jgi:hypothetical protein
VLLLKTIMAAMKKLNKQEEIIFNGAGPDRTIVEVKMLAFQFSEKGSSRLLLFFIAAIVSRFRGCGSLKGASLRSRRKLLHSFMTLSLALM